MTRQGVRQKKEQELRPEGTCVILRYLASVVSHVATFMGQREM